MILDQQYEMVDVGRLQPHPRNVNQGDIGAIHQSVEANGFYGAVIAQRSSGFILAGKHRWIAARQRAFAEIPVIWVDCDDAAALRIMLADNRTARLGVDDEVALAELLVEIQREAGSMKGTGYDQDALDQIMKDAGLAPSGDQQNGSTDQSGELKSKYDVLVTCESEQQQVELLSTLAEGGYNCRALVA